ncbi:hypothetical protein [Brucella thiophenivorans]|uniref:Uncharacterized protein n=1 Tax=Brucella thiophenivorans TaxID=571255 RepID=A0A256FU66_9HYPH|nr:hypothetical protein [Brucella thiophenivorans]OYR18256.1 hypothetical protein CEV31_4268 [Brucella thiophenivorans]
MPNKSNETTEDLSFWFIFSLGLIVGVLLSLLYFLGDKPLENPTLRIEKTGGGEATVSIGEFATTVQIKDGEFVDVKMPFPMRHSLLRVTTDGEAKILLRYCKHTFSDQIEFTGSSPTRYSAPSIPAADKKECEHRIIKPS